MAVHSCIKHDHSGAARVREPIIEHIQNTPTHKRRFCRSGAAIVCSSDGNKTPASVAGVVKTWPCSKADSAAVAERRIGEEIVLPRLRLVLDGADPVHELGEPK